MCNDAFEREKKHSIKLRRKTLNHQVQEKERERKRESEAKMRLWVAVSSFSPGWVLDVRRDCTA